MQIMQLGVNKRDEQQQRQPQRQPQQQVQRTTRRTRMSPQFGPSFTRPNAERQGGNMGRMSYRMNSGRGDAPKAPTNNVYPPDMLAAPQQQPSMASQILLGMQPQMPSSGSMGLAAPTNTPQPAVDPISMIQQGLSAPKGSDAFNQLKGSPIGRILDRQYRMGELDLRDIQSLILGDRDLDLREQGMNMEQDRFGQTQDFRNKQFERGILESDRGYEQSQQQFEREAGQTDRRLGQADAALEQQKREAEMRQRMGMVEQGNKFFGGIADNISDVVQKIMTPPEKGVYQRVNPVLDPLSGEVMQPGGRFNTATGEFNPFGGGSSGQLALPPGIDQAMLEAVMDEIGTDDPQEAIRAITGG